MNKQELINRFEEHASELSEKEVVQIASDLFEEVSAEENEDSEDRTVLDIWSEQWNLIIAVIITDAESVYCVAELFDTFDTDDGIWTERNYLGSLV